MRKEIAEYKTLALVILVNNQPAGMIDLHNIKLDKSKCGNWLLAWPKISG